MVIAMTTIRVSLDEEDFGASYIWKEFVDFYQKSCGFQVIEVL